MEKPLYFDIGSLYGCDSAYALSRGFSVVTVEANPSLIPQLSRKFAREIVDDKLELIHRAIVPECYDKPTVFLNVNADHPEWSSCIRWWGRKPVEVATIKISELYNEYGVPDVLKMDVESMESSLINGIKDFPQRPRLIITELSHASLFPLLQAMGYTKFRLSNQNNRTTNGWEKYPHGEDGSGPFSDELTIPWQTASECMQELDTLDKANFWCDLHATGCE